MSQKSLQKKEETKMRSIKELPLPPENPVEEGIIVPEE
jgi:hypothetical protein